MDKQIDVERKKKRKRIERNRICITKLNTQTQLQ